MTDEFERTAYDLICLSRFGALYHGMVKTSDIKMVADYLKKNIKFLKEIPIPPPMPVLPKLPALPVKQTLPPLPALPPLPLPPLPKLPK